MNITNELNFLKSIDGEKNAYGHYIYESANKKSTMNLAFVLQEYLVYMKERKLITINKK